jgi:hypothetical protein
MYIKVPNNVMLTYANVTIANSGANYTDNVVDGVTEENITASTIQTGAILFPIGFNMSMAQGSIVNSVWLNITGMETQYTPKYDEIDDSWINQTLWYNWTQVSTFNTGVATTSEDTTAFTVYGKGTQPDSRCYHAYGYAYIQSLKTDFDALSEINISVNTVSVSQFHNTPGCCAATTTSVAVISLGGASASYFQRVWTECSGYSDTGELTSGDLIQIKNDGNGTANVYRNGAFLRNITPGDGMLQFVAYTDGFMEVHSWQDVTLSINYVRYWSQPKNMLITLNGSQIYNYTGPFLTTQRINLNSTAFQNYLNTCPDSLCKVPYKINTSTEGSFKINAVELNYSGLTSNITIDTGDDGTADWNFTGGFGSLNTTTIDLKYDPMNTYVLSHCTNFTCYVPIKIATASAGTLVFSNLTIKYSLNALSINTTPIINYLSNSASGYINVPINFTSQSNGTCQISNINMPFYGSDNISVFAHYDGNVTYTNSNSTRNIFVKYSNYNLSMPSGIKYLEFLPRYSTQPNVTPYGQNYITPILNITTKNYDVSMNLSIRLDNTSSCVNITASNSSSKSTGVQLNTSYKDILIGRTLLSNSGLWLWADYACNSSNWTLFNPNIYIRGCAFNSTCGVT